jgi:hypothetical protein
MILVILALNQGVIDFNLKMFTFANYLKHPKN